MTAPDDVQAAMDTALAGNAAEWPLVALSLRSEVARLRVSETALSAELGRVYGYLARAEEERDALWQATLDLRARLRDYGYLIGMELRAESILNKTDKRFRTMIHQMVARYILTGR